MTCKSQTIFRLISRATSKTICGGASLLLLVSAANAASHTTDITGKILSNTSADCTRHTGIFTTRSTDVQRGNSYVGSTTVSTSGNTCTIDATTVPNHDVNDGERSFRHVMEANTKTFSIPHNPTLAGSSSELSHRSYDAIMLSGVPVDVLSAGCYAPDSRGADANGNTRAGCRDTDPWLIDPPSAGHFFGEDSHSGHTQPDGTYHYHGNPMALFDSNPGASGSPVIGFAADGFPIFGSYFKDDDGKVRKVLSGYSLKQGSRPAGVDSPGGDYNGYYIADWEFTDAGDLDECNGMTVNGQYGYYITDSYPWILKCHMGTPDRSFSKR